uniref:Protein FAR1-RELATED SEQUENCE n=1 Tax=Triticum urartu TaxID=4572 RepID=A0A8R7QUP6_TRIUA
MPSSSSRLDLDISSQITNESRRGVIHGSLVQLLFPAGRNRGHSRSGIAGGRGGAVMEGKMVIAILLPQVLHLKFKRQRKIFFNVPDIDQTDSHREHPSESQRTPTLWPQRARVGKIPDRRASLSGSSLEKAMRNFADKKSGTVHKPEISEEFDSLDEAYNFYNLYSWETGFGIKYGQCRRNVDKCKRSRTWFSDAK